MNTIYLDFGEDNYSEDYIDNINYTDVIRSVCDEADIVDEEMCYW